MIFSLVGPAFCLGLLAVCARAPYPAGFSGSRPPQRFSPALFFALLPGNWKVKDAWRKNTKGAA
jgi:hypothetical protein